MEKHTLQELINQNLSQRDLAQRLNVSQSTIKYWLEKYGLKTQRKTIQQNFCCKICGDKDPKNSFSLNKRENKFHRSLCVNCQREKNSINWRKNKQSFVDYKGGKCEICGYSKCIGALHFHHIDPTVKDDNWNLFKNRLLKNVKEELDKCKLLCANCHSELHFNET